jgi:hypothetical protein
VTSGAEKERRWLPLGSPLFGVRPPSRSRFREADQRLPTINGIASPGQIRPSQLITFLRQKLRQFLDINIHQVNRRDFAGMGSDAHDKILADSIDNEEAVVVTADREPTGMT